MRMARALLSISLTEGLQGNRIRPFGALWQKAYLR